MIFVRYGAASLAALVLVSSMFFFLHALVSARGGLADLKPAARIEFSRLRRDTEAQSRREDKAKLEMKSAAPMAPTMVMSGRGTSAAAPVIVAPAKMGETVATVQVKKMMVKASGSDRDTVPLVRIEPAYPQRAVERGIEGWVLVRFTITPIGTVKDVVVVESNPPKVFDDAAVQAVLHWKYNPKIEDGVAVERRGVQTILRFQLTKE
jgi:protein TonB